MKSQLKNELAMVRGIIDEFIADDPFPALVRPEELREAVRLYPMRGGKRLRPVLALWACGAVGGETSRALNAAAAVEIFHNWTLVHDDIIDCDEVRRGKPTCHVEPHVLNSMRNDRRNSARILRFLPEMFSRRGRSMCFCVLPTGAFLRKRSLRWRGACSRSSTGN